MQKVIVEFRLTNRPTLKRERVHGNVNPSQKGGEMLRIGIHDEGDLTTFSIEGKLTVPSAIELEQCWHEAKVARPSRNFVVKLTSVTFIDSESRELLTRMRRQGVKLVPRGCLMHSIVDQIEHQVAEKPFSS